MTDMLATLGAMAKEERTYVLTRCYPLFGAYYFDLKMADFMGDMVAFSDAHPWSVILIPAGHTKSATFGKYNLIRQICFNPNVRIQLIMSVFDDASDYCKSVEYELEFNEKLKADFGEFYNPKDWTSSTFTVKQRQHNDPHPTLSVFGAGGKAPNWTLKGHGCDIVVSDDVVTEDTALSPESRNRQRSWFNMAVRKNPRPMWPISPRYGLMVPDGIDWPRDAPYNPRPDSNIPFGQIIVPGTRFDPKDLYQDLIDDPLWNSLTLDCWLDEEETKPLWPDYWTNEALHAERESGLIYFNKRMRNRPMDESEMTFHRECFVGDENYPGCLNRSRSFGELPKDDEGHTLDLYKVLGFDPASGEATKYATWPTFDLLGFPREGDPTQDTRYLIDAFRAQVGPEYLIDILLGPDPRNPGYQASLHPGFYDKYHYDLCRIERNGFAGLLIGHHRITEAKRKGVLIEPHVTGRNKIDPVTGVKSMAAMIRDGLLDIPYKTDTDRKLANEIIDQFCYFSFDRNGRRRSLTDHVMAPLDVETPLWTTSGWTTMAEVEVGHEVATPYGETAPVVALTPIEAQETYRVTFDDGTSLVASADHRWFAYPVDRGAVRREPRWMTTDELARWDGRRVMLARPLPIETSDRHLEVPPYVLGVWLGDGDARQGTIFGHDDDTPFIRSEFERLGIRTTDQKRGSCFGTNGLRSGLGDIGVLQNKHVPKKYLFAGGRQRLDLLRGLMDTDGSVMNDHGRVYFANTNLKLTAAVVELARSLGFRVNVQDYVASTCTNPQGGVSPTKPYQRIVFTADATTLNPFLMPRKSEKVRAFLNNRRPRRFLTVKSVVPVGQRAVRCITVGHPLHEFLAGSGFVPTGNCWFAELAIRALRQARECHRAPGSPYVLHNPYFSQREKVAP
jgi:hypothetical protein